MKYCFLNPPRVSSAEDCRSRAAEALKILAASEQEHRESSDSRWKGWVSMHQAMREALSVESLVNFQSHPAIAPQITGGSGNNFLSMIGDSYGHQVLQDLLSAHVETICGQPKDLVCENGIYLTVTSMRHLYHVAHLKHYCNAAGGRAPLVFVEIGGGFGNLARMVCWHRLCSKYFIIDHPVVQAIQYYFLTEFLPPEQIGIIGEYGGYLNGSAGSLVQLVSLFRFEEAIETIHGPYAVVSSQALTEIDQPGQDRYMSSLSPDLIYVFGQYQLKCLAGGESAGSRSIDNAHLVCALGEKFHTLLYNFFGYHFEFIGRGHSLTI